MTARNRTIGIAKQPLFGTYAPSATHVLVLTEPAMFDAQVERLVNSSALGSSYMHNDMDWRNRFATASFDYKVDEDTFPLLFAQRFDVATTTTSQVGTHVLTFGNNTNNYYTLFMQDDDIGDYVIGNALFETHTIALDQEYVRMTSSVIGAYPSASTVTNVISQPKEFVGRMVNYSEDDVPGTVTSTNILSAGMTFNFGINSTTTRFGVGSGDLQHLTLTQDEYMMNISKIKTNTSVYDDANALTTKQFRVVAENTDRYIEGQTITRPLIQFDVPRAKIDSYTENPSFEDVLQESFDARLLKPVGVSDAPIKITIKNHTLSY